MTTATLETATDVVFGHEKAWSLSEIHEQSSGSRGFHRYRKIMVKRKDGLAVFSQDMGDVKKYKGVRPFTIPSFWEHTVDELLDIADYLRHETRIDVKDWLELDKLKIV